MGYIGKVSIDSTEYSVAPSLFGTCDTAANSAAKIVTCSDFTTLIQGVTIKIKFTNSNTAENATMNINGTGAKPIYIYGTERPGTTESKSWKAGAVVDFTYDTNAWRMGAAGGGGGGSDAYIFDTLEEAQAAIAQGEVEDGSIVNIIEDYDGIITGSMVTYDNTISGLSSTSVQGAIDELNSILKNSGGGSVVKVTTTEPSLIGQEVTLVGPTQTKTNTLDSMGIAYFSGILDTGSFIISASDGTETATKIISINGDFKLYDVTLTFAPVPTGLNLQDWLDAGGVTGTYADFAAVEADEKAVRKLMTKHASVDYLATSDGTDELIVQVINSDICAKWINLRDYALDTLSANSDIKALMDVSDKTTFIPQVPVMTSNTTPEGEVFYSGVYASGGYSPYTVFNGDEDTLSQGWGDDSSHASPYIGYGFTSPHVITKFRFSIRFRTYGTANALTFTLQGSNEKNGTYTDIGEYAFSGVDTSSTYVVKQDVDVVNNTAYQYYRVAMNQTMQNSTTNYFYFLNIQFYSYSSKYGYGEWALVGQVPKMTSNTAPYGVAFASTENTSTYSAYTAFDGNASNAWLPSLGDSTPHIGYKFTSPQIITKVDILFKNVVIGTNLTAYVEGSDDGTTYTPITSETITLQSSSIQTIKFSNSTAYLYYRVRFSGALYVSGQYNAYIDMLQFYTWAPKGNVPVMTSNTAPYGEASASSSWDSTELYKPWTVFDDTIPTIASNGNQGSAWDSANNDSGAWIQYKFTNPVCVRRVLIDQNCNGIGRADSLVITDKVSLLASNDGVNFVTLSSDVALPKYHYAKYTDILNDSYYLYYRIKVPTYTIHQIGASATYNFSEICRLQFYGRELSVSVPTMTSNTAPWGEASASSYFPSSSSNPQPYKAFDGNTSTQWLSARNASDEWVRYDFVRAMMIKVLKIRPYYDGHLRLKTVILQASTDGNIWTDLWTHQFADSSSEAVDQNFSVINNNEYSHYRLLLKNDTADDAKGLLEANFYGLDYSEREFAEGSTMKYIYDHGVELEEINTTGANGELIKEPSQLKITTPSTSSSYRLATYGNDNVDVSDYDYVAASVGDAFVWNGSGNDNQIGAMKSGSPLGYTVFGMPVTNPRQTVCSLASVNQAVTLYLSAASVSRVVTVKEWWLE